MPVLYAAGEEIGRTGPELPNEVPEIRSWPLKPGPAFARVVPLVREVMETQATIGSSPPPRIDPHMAPDQIMDTMRTWIETHPDVKRRMDAFRDFTELALELREDDGTPITAASVGITELPVTEDDAGLAGDNYREMGFAGNPPFYLVVLTVVPLTLERMREIVG